MGNTLIRPVLDQADLDTPATLTAKLSAGSDANALVVVRKGGQEHHCTPLAYALIYGNTAAANALLQAGADPNRVAGFKSPLGLKPLLISTALGKLLELTQLLACGADVNAKTSLFALQCFVMPPTASFVPGASFHHTTGGDTPLHIAINSGNAAIVQLLLQQPSVDVNCLNDRGRSPLYKACKRNRVDLVSCLIQHPSIDVNAGVPISAAIASTNNVLVDLLLSKGANMVDVNEARQTPMQHLVTKTAVVFSGRADMIRQLHRAGGDVNCMVQAGTSALDYAIERRWAKVEAALRQCGTHRSVDRRRLIKWGRGQQQTPQQQAPRQGMAQQQAQQQRASRRATSASGPAQPPPAAPPVHSSSALPVPAAPAGAGPSNASPSATAPHPPQLTAPPLSSEPAGLQGGQCCLCLEEPAVMGFVHAAVVHTCLCEDCLASLKSSSRGVQNCLICNSAASGVIRVVGT